MQKLCVHFFKESANKCKRLKAYKLQRLYDLNGETWMKLYMAVMWMEEQA